jgi:acyl-CoA reductase-like NAD-dependent aldehyde dehydrogenase
VIDMRTAAAPAHALNVTPGRGWPSPGWSERENPARTDEVATLIELADPAGVAATVTGAVAAGRAWAGLGLADRITALLAAAKTVDGDAEVIAVRLARESGKAVGDCRVELQIALKILRTTAAQAHATLADEQPAVAADARLTVFRQPFGVIAAIVPWNAPLVLAMTKVAPALCAGNTIVVKPSPLAAAAVTALLSALAAALPSSVLSVIQGGAAVGEALVRAPGVQKVAFTGGASAARSIMHAAADRLLPVALELGGNDAAIVLPGACFDRSAMTRAVMATYRTSGQVCMAAKRWYVPRDQLGGFVDDFAAVAAEILTVGDPLDAGTTTGPVATAEQRDRLGALTADAVGRGGRRIKVGRMSEPGLLQRGYFVEPTLILDGCDHWPLVAQEQFGPVAPVLAYDTVDEAIARANATAFGLGSSLWTHDEERAFALARRLEAGYTFVNTHNLDGLSLDAPFGGVKESGFGREFGAAGLHEFTTSHAVHRPTHARMSAERHD